ncbi:unnamed protein product [Mesocestoides corti]|uniref:Uncharacterized protein n=1 Tax=Mesocestoides corti TaxID=53468 RepID=A0A3P6HT18_MESCO|nr:unnamed protein product [Mesocestoides corti]
MPGAASRTTTVSGLSRARGGVAARCAPSDSEFEPLMLGEGGDEIDTSPPQRSHRSDRLMPDTPWDDEGASDDGNYVFVRPDFISVPQDSPKL